jgi:hypothetical protein
VLAKEIERAGIPVVYVTSLPTVATMIGANRIVERALDMLETDVERNTVWEVEQ